jgi:hypothetical protein
VTAVSDRLDAIQKRLDAAAPGTITITPSDVAWLRDTARKQQAQLDAVRELAERWQVDFPHKANLIREALEAKP